MEVAIVGLVYALGFLVRVRYGSGCLPGLLSHGLGVPAGRAEILGKKRVGGEREAWVFAEWGNDEIRMTNVE
jgi:hypothetical protein